MLQIMNTSEIPVRPREFRPHLTITGQSLAKGHRQPWERSVLAAHWVLGSLEFKPTIAIASFVFGVSVQLIRRTVAEIKARGASAPAPDEIELAWAGSEEFERDDFVLAHFNELFDRADRLTAASSAT